ncbi:pirin family protein [Pararhodobacter sp. CCB-MM2]|uniref:pirin family protein n=1 Tax=Pararhodobacter sp. CCB-MM2 TaxID=1786003 RepID=UPI0008331007|nr:pirin family protein [Pararhodobacter sp. CCB-MM2]MCA2012457.1 pirin family protein [Cereibacter sphaeroides]
MSWNPALAPGDLTEDPASLETLIVPRARDIGGFEVRRALPAAGRRMVGPFVFFDQMGPAEFITGEGIDVRPHPHIGLGTVTYLLDGHFIHKDSLGTDQKIVPGEVNWMIAGRGITHSERTDPPARQHPQKLFGVQTWLALPENREEMAPEFEHHGKDALPMLSGEGKEVRLILGHAWGEKAPVSVFGDLFYADAVLEAGAMIPMPDGHEDRGLHVLSGSVSVAGQEIGTGQMAVFRPGDAITLKAGPAGARLMLLGGDTLNGPRYIWWNFVSSSKERIEEAKDAWRRGEWGQGLFSLPPGDDAEYIPLPP